MKLAGAKLVVFGVGLASAKLLATEGAELVVTDHGGFLLDLSLAKFRATVDGKCWVQVTLAHCSSSRRAT